MLINIIITNFLALRSEGSGFVCVSTICETIRHPLRAKSDPPKLDVKLGGAAVATGSLTRIRVNN